MSEMMKRGRPKSSVRIAAEAVGLLPDHTPRTRRDHVKSATVLKTIFPEGFDNSHQAWAEFQKRWPKFFRGGHTRITVLRHFYPIAHYEGFAEMLTEFHNDDWRTAEEGEKIAKFAVRVITERLAQIDEDQTDNE